VLCRKCKVAETLATFSHVNYNITNKYLCPCVLLLKCKNCLSVQGNYCNVQLVILKRNIIFCIILLAMGEEHFIDKLLTLIV
jgi:hypothetical protein